MYVHTRNSTPDERCLQLANNLIRRYGTTTSTTMPSIIRCETLFSTTWSSRLGNFDSDLIGELIQRLDIQSATKVVYVHTIRGFSNAIFWKSSWNLLVFGKSVCNGMKANHLPLKCQPCTCVVRLKSQLISLCLYFIFHYLVVTVNQFILYMFVDQESTKKILFLEIIILDSRKISLEQNGNSFSQILAFVRQSIRRADRFVVTTNCWRSLFSVRWFLVSESGR